jgi:DNA-binding CsgD family transcriptional regulator
VTIASARELHLRPLTDQQSRSLLGERYGERLAADAAESVLRSAGGNPLALLELGAGVVLEGTELPTVEERYAARIRALDPHTQTLLLLAAADDAAGLDVVAQAAGSLDLTVEALEPAETAGLVSVVDGTIRFKHPLVRSAAYKTAPFAHRQRAHLALASVTDRDTDPERRAWHRAAAAAGPDEETACELEQSAARASARSGYAAASRALERAAQLSTSAPDRARRLVDAAEDARLAGQRERALALLTTADVPSDAVPLRVRAARIRGVIEAQSGLPADAMRIFLDAAALIHPLDRRAALELVTLAQEAAGLGGERDAIVEFGTWGKRFEEPETVEERIMLGLVRGFGDLLLGDKLSAGPSLSRAADLGAATVDPQLLVWAATAAMFLGEDRRVFELLSRAVSEARTRGAIGALPFALHLLAGVERRLGHMPAAEADADESLRLARETGQEVVAAGALSTLTALAAFRGDSDRAHALAAETRALATPRRLAVAQAGVDRALAELDLARGRADDALERLLPLFRTRDQRVRNEPYALFTTPVYVEAAARAGQTNGALEQLAAFEQWAEEGALGWARPIAARCRALLAVDGDEAEKWFSQALAYHESYPHAFERARTALLFGEMLRRGRRKREARRHLRGALETFQGLGARAWAERAAAELRATGATARRRDESTRADLTPQELQIVRLVAEGKTNPETAAQLFLSPKTVQYHLRKVFAKLGISSRTELVRLVAERSVAGAVEDA